MIYNEIIILNFFNFNENTNFNIKERNVNDRLLSENLTEIELNDIGDYYIKNDSDDNRDTKGRKSDSF